METAQAEMPRYKSHKTVWALKIKAIQPTPADTPIDGGSWRITPEDTGYAPFDVPHSYYLKHQPQDGGYYVVYSDGYKSFSPAAAFEDGYTPA